MTTDPMDQALDEVDRVILRVLSKHPRMSYTSIAERLEEEGIQMSAEAVRHRVGNLLDATSAFFLFAPGEHDWEILRLGVTVVDARGAKEEVKTFLTDIGFWLICNGLGTIDIYAVGTSVSIADIETIIGEVRAHDLVTSVDFNIETGRVTALENYFSALGADT